MDTYSIFSMKKNLPLLLIAFFCTTFLFSQIKKTEVSPLQNLTQIVGVTEVRIEYSRPSAKNRIIFGDLVSYGELWRTGANWSTKISFDNPVKVGDTRLEAGSYSIYTIPMASEWEVIFYKDSAVYGLPEVWDESLVAARVMGSVLTLPIGYETFTINLDSVLHSSANLSFIWEKTYVSIPLYFDTDAIVEASIQETLSGPKAIDYYTAAVYYFEAGKDIKQALTWINKAVDMMGRDAEYFVYRQQALINAKSGNIPQAIKAAERSLELAEKVGDSLYVEMNKKSIESWK